VLSIGRDVSAERGAERERRRLESQLRQAQKMEAIGHLTGGIAHDFNNILASIMGYNVLALERTLDAGDTKTAGYLDEALASCRRARDLIQQMLMFSRGQHGEPHRLSLGRLIDDSAPLLRSSLPPTIQFEFACDPAAPPVRADEIQAGQVLLNLCINARDAMQGMGTLSLAVRELDAQGLVCASCRAAVGGRHVALSVADNGSGIEPALLDRIFEPFFSTKEKGKGSGMGLSMVHGIVHEHGGHVLVDSTPGRGATFTVLWPAADGPADAAAAAAGGPQRARTRLAGRVLLVDDEAAVRGFLREMLGGWGLAVTAAQDAREALRLFDAADGAFDLVITDQAMPAMTGLALTAELRRRRPRLPVLLCSGYTDDGHAAEAARCGVQQVLRKPLEAAELRAAVEAALAAQRPAESRPVL
jgi:nitrogen-specific signal transduction histidine kinase/CheY-like chemotaxis protein